MASDHKISKIRKRDGRIVDFDQEKITKAVWAAAQAVGGRDRSLAERLSDQVVAILEHRFPARTPTVENVQDIVEKVLIEDGHARTAKAYILYRKQHESLRKIKTTFLEVERMVSDYLSQVDWRVRENSNIGYSMSGLLLHVAGSVVTDYTLDRIYPMEIADAHRNGDIHLHDLYFGITGYCAGWSLSKLLHEGFNGVPGIVESKPAKHLDTALLQMVNFIGTLQNEWAGAQAFNSIDTYLAPFVRKDKLNCQEIKQAIQKFVFNLNIASRWGGQSPFTNLTLDWTVPDDLKKQPVVLGGKLLEETYDDYQKEMNLINKAFIEVLTEGDMNGRPFTFPIPTYNLTRDFDWETENARLLLEMTAKYGLPYFSNFINSDLNPSDIRSMCCRLRLNLRQLDRNITGGLFGSGDSTGSVGVVTMNMPRIAYLSRNKDDFFRRLEYLMGLAKISLETKRKIVEKNMEGGLLPYTKRYLGTLKNHFSTIGPVGVNEACLNLLGKDIASEEGKSFAVETLKFMRTRLSDFQEETSHIYNLEAVPAEGSLAPEEKVLISQSDPELTEIGPLIDSYLEKNKDETQIFANSEVLRISPGEMFTYGFSRRTQKIKKYPVTALVRHPGKSMYEITTVSGRKVKVTGEHSVFTLNSRGMPEEVLVKNLKEGIPIAIPKKIKMENTHKEFNLIEVFKGVPFKNKMYGLFSPEFIEKLIGNSRVREWSNRNYRFDWKDVKCMWRKNKAVPLRLIYELDVSIDKETLKSTRIFYRHSKNTKSINALIPINEDFGFIIGSLLSEGWLSEKSEFTSTDEKLAEEFFHLAGRVFGPGSACLSPAIRRKAPRKPRYVVILSKVIGLFFKEIGLQGKSGEKKIPNFLFYSSLDCISGLLRGFYLGDGYVYKNKEKRDFSLRLFTNSKELAEGLNLLLLRLGILAKIREDKKSDYNSLWNDNYILSITGASNLEKYFRIVLKERLRLNNVSSSREIIPEVPKLIKQILQKYSVKPSDINIYKDSFNRNVRKNRISIQYFEKIIGKLSNLVEDEDIKKFKILINSDIYWDKIKDIKKLTPPKYVYDLEVDVKDELVNNFLGGSGLVCLHNTSYRLARMDKRKYPDIITAGKGVPYYTNSTLLPVDKTEDVIEALEHQEELQTLYTGGTVFHIFLGERMSSGEAVKRLLKKIAYNTKLPYFTITPTYSICSDHGYLVGEHLRCPTCGKEMEVYSRVVGYFRPVRNWNEGKQEEFRQRVEYKEKIALEKELAVGTTRLD